MLLHLLQLYILSYFIFLFLMYVPFVLATVVPDDDGQRGPDEEDRRDSKIHQGNAGKLGNYPILSVLPDKFARFLFEYHSHRFESLDLPQLPADRSDFDVHGALLDDKVQTNCNALHFAQS